MKEGKTLGSMSPKNKINDPILLDHNPIKQGIPLQPRVEHHSTWIVLILIIALCIGTISAFREHINLLTKYDKLLGEQIVLLKECKL